MYELIEHKKLDTAAASITFSNIPQIYTDLMVLVSARQAGTAIGQSPKINGSTANFSGRFLEGSGSSASSYSTTDIVGYVTKSTDTANTFSNTTIYIPNYRSNVAKSISVDSVTENNATAAFQLIGAVLWNSTDPVTSFEVISNNGTNITAGSSATLYGINRTSAFGKPKAIGGNITYANGYWVHTFTGSGTFYAQQDLNVEALVVAGGGGGGGAVGNGGGGGAGGVLTTTGTVLKGSATPVMVGAGGAGMQALQVASLSNGYNSQFLSAIAIGGGGGGGYNGAFANAQKGANGGSGGGAWSWASQGGAKGLGTPGQGNDGGLPTVRPGDYAEVTGGGGGAGAVGGNGSSTTTGNGGDGIFWNGAYYGGGGGGGGALEGSSGGTFGLGGLGGGGRGGDRSVQPNGSSGQANTGGGGGGNSVTSRAVNPQYAGNGGSGVVIIRYPAAEIRSAEPASPGVQYKIDPLTIQGAWTFATSENATYGGHTTLDYNNVGTIQPYVRKWSQYPGALSTQRLDLDASGMRLSAATNWVMANEQTIEMWVYPEYSGNLGRLFTWGNRQDNACTLIDRNTSTGQLLVRTNTALASTSGYAPYGQWSWVVLSKRGSELRMFVNGIQVYYNTNGDGGGYTTDGRYFTLGADWDSGYMDAPRFSGAAYWQDVIVYNAAPFHSMSTIPVPTMPLTDRII